MESTLVWLELKYCERCGALWLRLKGAGAVFCGTCAKALLELPGWTEKDPATEAVVAPLYDAQSAFWVEGGHA